MWVFCVCVKNLPYKNVSNRTRKFLFIFLVEQNLVKTQRCTQCLLASYYLLLFTPFSNKKIRENEVANSQSRRLCSAPTSMTVLKRLRPFGSSLWHYLSVQKERSKGKRTLHMRPRLLDLIVFRFASRVVAGVK